MHEKEINECDFGSIYTDTYSICFDPGVNKLTEVFYTSGIDPLDYIKVVPEEFLSNSQSVFEVDIQEGVEELGDSCFYSCANLRKITLPKSCSRINSWAIADCETLESIEIKGDIKYISHLGIYRNKNLKNIKCT